MLKRLGLIVAASLLIAAPPAFAGAFVGASVLDTSVEVDDADGSGNSFDGSDTGFKVYGGFDFAKFFRLEASYLDLGSPDEEVGGSDVQVDINAWDGFAVLVIPIGKHFEVFGKAGLVLWDTEAEISGVGSEDDSGTDAAYGIGAAFKLGKRLAVRAEYEQFDVEDIDTLDALSLGLDIRF
jgi:OOP family OmpA-OmpF porin